MTIAQIEENINQFITNFDKDSFLFDLLLAYGFPKATITRHKKGELNQLKQKGEFTIRKKLFFKIAESGELHNIIDTLHTEFKTSKAPTRFIIVTDYKTFLAVDTKTDDTLDIELLDLTKHYDFFLPWAGMEKSQLADENPADVKAAQKLAKLYDEIQSEEDVHALNVFLTRLLFCYFAEDSAIFSENQFTNAIKQHTREDGSDLDSYLIRLFEILDTKKRTDDIPDYLKAFAYVNGELFKKRCKIPKFTAKSRRIMIEIGTLNWSVINPDIFGSMIQAVVTDEYRGDKGMHYTSVPNILKVIEPLFLDELNVEFEKAKGNTNALNRLHHRISTLKIFDPACGSGNFLIIAYKELRKLEMKIFKEGGLLISPSIKLSQFYGIEIDDFAHEVAKLSLWLAEHQMNMLFKKEFGTVAPPLPLKDSGNIVHGNATRIDWEEVCPKVDGNEIYVLGNPPYLGFRNWDDTQKEDMKFIFKDSGNVKRLDYISCWFKKSSDYIVNSNAEYSFVSTNSISQGEQVSLIWPYIFSKNQEIKFGYQPFDWINNAKGKAKVTCIIVGVQNRKDNYKTLYYNHHKNQVKNISPYLIPGDSIVMYQRKTSISHFPTMVLGSSGVDGGHLMLTSNEKNTFIENNSLSSQFIKSFLSGGDFLNDVQRFCLWIDDDDIVVAKSINDIYNRIEKCRLYRESAGRDAKKYANVPHRFIYKKHKNSDAILLPRTSSGRRHYLPLGFVTKDTIVSNQAFVIYNAAFYLFGILSSKMHFIWMSITSGKMRNDFSYSVNLTYNTFPFPNISEKQKEILTEHTFKILEEREKNSEKTLAQLYDPDKMPDGLKKVHHELDLAIERCYRKKLFVNDEERLKYLFGLYEEMMEEK